MEMHTEATDRLARALSEVFIMEVSVTPTEDGALDIIVPSQAPAHKFPEVVTRARAIITVTENKTLFDRAINVKHPSLKIAG